MNKEYKANSKWVSITIKDLIRTWKCEINSKLSVPIEAIEIPILNDKMVWKHIPFHLSKSMVSNKGFICWSFSTLIKYKKRKYISWSIHCFLDHVWTIPHTHNTHNIHTHIMLPNHCTVFVLVAKLNFSK